MNRGARRAALAVAIGAVALDSALIGLIAPLLPQIEARTGASPGQIGAALAAYAVPIVILSIPIGAAANRVGRRNLLIGGLLMTTAGSVLIATSHSLELLISGRAVQGLGSVASWVAALAVVSDLAPPGRRGEALGFAFAANGAGALAGPALGGITADALGFEAPFVIVATLSAALVVGAALVRIPEARSGLDLGRIGSRLRTALGVASGRAGAALALSGAAAFGLIEVVVPLDTDDRLGLSASALGLLFTGAIAVDSVLAPIAGRAGDRSGRLAPAAAGSILLIVAFVGLAMLPGTLLLGLALALTGAGLSLVFSSGVPWLDEAFGADDRGLAYGALNLVYAAGYVIGPAAGGLIFGGAGATEAYLAGAAAVAALSLPLIALSR